MFSFKSLRFVLVVAAAFHAVPSTAVNTVDLGDAGDFAILSEKGITTVPASVITGDIGVSPITGASMTGFIFTMHEDLANGLKFATAPQLSTGSKAYASDSGGTDTEGKMIDAVAAMRTAYNDAAGRTNDDEARKNLGGGLIGGLTLTTGIYTFSTDVLIAFGTDITFAGSATDIFIIQIAGNFIQSAETKMILTGTVKPENIFWQVAGYTEVGAGANMEGVLLAMTSATFITGSTLNGRILSQSNVALQKATITEKPDAPVVRRSLLRKGV
jgi:hypothetical protein